MISTSMEHSSRSKNEGDLREPDKTLRHAVGTLVRGDFFENEVEVVEKIETPSEIACLLVVGEATINVGSTQLTVTDGSIFHRTSDRR